MTIESGRIPASGDRATRPTDQAPAGLGDTASVPCAASVRDVVHKLEWKDFEPFARRAADEIYEHIMASCEDHLRDNVEWNIGSHISMLERENERMRTELHEVDRIVGPPWCTPVERILRLREMDAAYAQLIELRYAVQFEPERAKAIATEARRAETPQSGSVHEGADPKGIAHKEGP